jgi:miniconductance mechanosensitive channel
LDITLTTVKVQNFDKTITTIPTYALVSDYFTNWRGMSESGGRRIKRSISIDMESVRFCTPEMFTRLKQSDLIQDFIRKNEIVGEVADDKVFGNFDSLSNGKYVTNLGVFRNYLTIYLKSLPGVHPEMPVVVRQLQSDEHGIPIEIYLFSNILEWTRYENLQSDIFDHILAVLHVFDLRVYQSTTSFKQAQ